MKKIFLFAAAVLALASCGKNDDGNTEGRIDILTGVEALTRAPQLDQSGKGSFTPGDTFTLTVSSNGKSVRKDYTVGSTSLYWQDLGVEGDKATFAGCYPNYAGNGGATFDFDVRSAPDADLLLAPAVEAAKGTQRIAMPFRHAMHRLVVKYVSDGSYAQEGLKGISSTLRAHTVCTVDTAKGAVTESSDRTPDDYAARSGEKVSWLVVPQSREGVKLTVTLDGQSREFSLPERTTEGLPITALEGGRELTLTMTVGKEGIDFGGMEIGGWDDQGSAEGDIIL